MSKFFKALEEAQRERALRERARPSEGEEAGPPRLAPGAPASPGEAGAPGATPGTPAPVPVPRGAGRQQEEALPGPERDVAQEAAGEPPNGVEEHLVSLIAPHSFEAEQYRALRHTVEQLHKAGSLSLVAVGSPAAGDGKTTTAINLAGALAQAPEARVLLVEADLRRPSVTVRAHLGLSGSAGLGLVDAILDPELALEDVVQRHPRFNLSLVAAGWRPTAPYEALKSPRLGELLEAARQRYDYIVLDAPPLLGLPDCRIIGKWIDGFLLVVAAHKTPRKLVEEALNVLDPAKVVGIVFNGDQRPLSGYYGYFYAYGQSPDSRRGRGQGVKGSGGFRWYRRSSRWPGEG